MGFNHILGIRIEITKFGGNCVAEVVLMNRFGQEEIDAVTEVIRSGELSSFFRDYRGGKWVLQFEEAFADYHGVEHAVSVSSGTAALHVALMACDVKKKKVVTTPYSFVSTASAIILAGGEPRFSDVMPLTYNLDPDKIEVKRGTKAIIPVHLLGHPAAMRWVMEIAEDKGLFVVEDCAQALGAKYKNKLVGTIGHLGFFSFQHTKTITTLGEGGMIITDNNTLAERCRYLRNHGEKYSSVARSMVGYNYRMTEAQAAFGLVQLGKLDKLNQTQIDNATYMCKRLPEAIEPPVKAPYATRHVYFLIGCLFNQEKAEMTRDQFLKKLEPYGLVGTRKASTLRPGHCVSAGYQKLLYQLPVLNQYPKQPCKTAESLLKKSLWIDLHRYDATLKDMDRYLKIFEEVLS